LGKSLYLVKSGADEIFEIKKKEKSEKEKSEGGRRKKKRVNKIFQV